jgi:cobalt-zinc-cadmium efflux system outer membrane protein
MRVRNWVRPLAALALLTASPLGAQGPQLTTSPPVIVAERATDSLGWIERTETDAYAMPCWPTAAAGLSLADVEAMALSANPAVGEARARVSAAYGNWVQVGLYPNPTIAYSGEEIGDEGTAGLQGGFVQQRFVTGHKLQLNRNVAMQQLQAAQQVLHAQELRVLTDVRMAYFRVLISQRQTELTRQLVGVGEQAVDINERLLRAAEVSRITLLQAQLEVDNARILARNAENNLEGTWREFAAVLAQPHLVQQQLAGDPSVLPPLVTWDEAVARTVGHHPLIAQAAEQADQARWQLQRARAENIPDVQVQAGPKYKATTGETVADVQVSLQIPLWNRNQGAIREAQAQISQAEQATQRVQLGLQEQLAAVYRRYANARSQVDRYEDHILKHSQDLYDLARQGFEAGELNYLDLLTAQRSYFQTNLAYLESLSDFWTAQFEIDGLMLSGSLRNP